MINFPSYTQIQTPLVPPPSYSESQENVHNNAISRGNNGRHSNAISIPISNVIPIDNEVTETATLMQNDLESGISFLPAIQLSTRSLLQSSEPSQIDASNSTIEESFVNDDKNSDTISACSYWGVLAEMGIAFLLCCCCLAVLGCILEIEAIAKSNKKLHTIAHRLGIFGMLCGLLVFLILSIFAIILYAAAYFML